MKNLSVSEHTERLRRILSKARNNQWEGHIPSQIPIKVKLAVLSLSYRQPNFWHFSAEKLRGSLIKYPYIKKEFEETNEHLLAFAIRERRM